MAPYDLPQTNREGMSATSKQKVLRSSGPRNNNRHVSNAMDLYRTPEPLPPVEPDSLSPIHEESPHNSLAEEFASDNGNENNSPLSNEALGLSGLSGLSLGSVQKELESEEEERNSMAASAARHELGLAGAAALARFNVPNNNTMNKPVAAAAANKRSRKNRKGSRRNNRKGNRRNDRKASRKNRITRRSGRRTRRSKN
jgi:hypothetical protein